MSHMSIMRCITHEFPKREMGYNSSFHVQFISFFYEQWFVLYYLNDKMLLTLL